MSTIGNDISPALKKTLEAVEKLGEVDAREVAKETERQYGRESSYLNKLAKIGYLVKRRSGHQTLFMVNKSAGLTILRIGGSVITHKETAMKINTVAIKQLSTEVAKVVKSGKIKNLVIIIGGGSFGHPIAREYNIGQTASPVKNMIRGYALNQYAMMQLRSLIVKELIDNDLSAMSIQYQGGIYQTDEKINLSSLQFLLNLGIIPVISAEPLIEQNNARIVSPDEIVYILSSHLRPSRAVFALDVDGIFTEDPKLSPKAKLIGEFYPKFLDKTKLDGAQYTDVTGGMYGKMSFYLAIARLGIEVKIINGTKPQRIEKALIGENVLGTLVKPENPET